MKLYGGIDLHSNNSVVVLLDEEDQVVYEKRLPNDLRLFGNCRGIGCKNLLLVPLSH